MPSDICTLLAKNNYLWISPIADTFARIRIVFEKFD